MSDIAAAAALAALAGCGGSDSGPAIHQAPPQQQLNQPVQHVFVIFKENHTYDNYFLGYPDPNEPNPPTQGMASNGRLVTITEPSKKDWSPGDNSFAVAHRDYDAGKMDGFDQDTHQPSSTGLDRTGHADGTDGAYVSYGLTEEIGRSNLGYYWFLADQGVLSDQWFSSELGPSFPNHLYALATSAGGAISNTDNNHDFQILNPATNETHKQDHLTAAEVATALPVELEQAGLTWTVLQEENPTPLDLLANFFLDDEASVRDIDVIHQLRD